MDSYWSQNGSVHGRRSTSNDEALRGCDSTSMYVLAIASGSSVLSGWSGRSGRPAERTPPSMVKWASIYSDAPLYRRRVQIRQPSGHARAGVVDDDVGLGEQALGVDEKPRDGRRVGGIYGESFCACLIGKCLSFLTSRAARPTVAPSADRRRASEALMPDPAPTMRAALYGKFAITIFLHCLHLSLFRFASCPQSRSPSDWSRSPRVPAPSPDFLTVRCDRACSHTGYNP